MITRRVVGAIGAVVVMAAVVLMPTIRERRIRQFCEGVQVGEDAASVWNRGSSFTRERSADEMDFSVSVK